MSKKYEPLTQAEKNWINKTFTKKEIDLCLLIFGGIPLDETFVRNNEQFKKLNNQP